MKSQATLSDPTLEVADFIQIDAACDRFEAAHHAGESPDLAVYLSEVPTVARLPLFRNLLGLDIEYRQRRGEQPDLQTYRERFPELADAIDSVFQSRLDSQPTTRRRMQRDRAIDGTGDTRPAEAGRDDREEVEPRGGLEFDAFEELSSAGYDVTRLLGRGGMGVVYQARQISLNRDVAIKLIRTGSFASEAEVLRFQNEAEAVAQLDHPHIVPIYEVGRQRRHHFFSMKLIAGTSLDKRLEAFVADPCATARLVAIAAEAIHHAHQRGILHRDLKPANILVDEQGEPHVTDFGLAKRIDADFEMTHSNALIGTPSYMAPEQASRDRGALSTATDVYGLGTILYALLTGRAPFSGTTLIETLDKVRSQSPEPPSKRNPRVPRDLEVICQKCLEKEPGRRYPSALALADDLNRWQRGEPIQARPVGMAVRSAMWCRRNPALASAAALLLLSMAVGFAGVAWQWRKAERNLAAAETLFELVGRRLLAQADAEHDPLAKNKTVRELLDNAAANIGGWVGGAPDVEARLRETIGGAYLSLGQYDRAEEHLKEAIRLDTQYQGPGGRGALGATNLRGTLLDRMSRSVEAEPILRRNLDEARRFLGRDDPICLDAAERLGAVLWHLGKLDEAEAVLRKNVADRSRVLQPEHADTLRSIYLFSRLLRERGELDEAQKMAYSYAHSVQCTRGSNHPDIIVALSNQGDVARALGKLDEAEPYYHRAAVEAARILGPQHRDTLAAEKTHAELLREIGR
ncbi:MAG: protein kinase domain-containing protein [Isosphaeraceae bacterium]